MTLKDWIKAEREAGRHWTMERVAEEIGIAPGNLSKAINGHVDARVGLVRKIEKLTRGKVKIGDWPDTHV